MDLDRITHPLRLAKGSHQPESGKGCAMNVISYINGDAQITDFPTCSAPPLALLVQSSNDELAGPDGYLSPENSLLALDLAWQTVGTADVPDTLVHTWVAELLANPAWGVVRYAKLTAIKVILDIAELHRAAGSGGMPAIADWAAAERAARAIEPGLNGAGMYAVRAAYQSTTLGGIHRWMTLNEVTAHVLHAHALATGSTPACRIVELSRQAIRSWRALAGLDDGGEIGTAAVSHAQQLTERDCSVTLAVERDASFTLAA